MQFPRIHLNGTDGVQLHHEYSEAIEALGAAIARLEAVTVHGRDYYTIPRPPSFPDPSCVAMDEHRARLNQLRSAYRDLISIRSNIQAQFDERKLS